MKYLKTLIFTTLSLGFLSSASYAEGIISFGTVRGTTENDGVDCKLNGQFSCTVEIAVTSVATSMGYGVDKTFGIYIQGAEAAVDLRSINGHGDSIVASCERYAVKAHTEGIPFKMSVNWLKAPPNGNYGATWLKANLIANHLDTPLHVKCFL